MPVRRSDRAAFTLAELLVVMSVMIILISVSAPALKGILGGKSRAAATGQMMGVLDRARSAALEKGAAVYIGFPTQGSVPVTSPLIPYSRYILFRDRVDGDTGPASQVFVPLTNWQQLPTGVVFARSGFIGNDAARVLIDGGENQFPRLPGAETVTSYRLAILKINAAGAVETPSTGTADLWLTEGFYRTSDFNFISTKKGATNPPVDRITISRYTGRARLETVPAP